MIEASQKEFIVEFGVDQKVEVTQLNYKGSKGYVSNIIINRNGIWYEVVLTDVVNVCKNNIMSYPEPIKYLSGMLKAI